MLDENLKRKILEETPEEQLMDDLEEIFEEMGFGNRKNE